MTLHIATNTRKSRYSRGPEALDKVDALIKEKMQRDPRSRLEYLAHELLHEISEQLYALRKEAELTQQELADKIDIPQSFIARLESPYTTNKHPSLSTLAKVAAALGRKLVVRFEKISKSTSIDIKNRREDITPYDLAANTEVERQDTDVDAELDLLGNLVIDGISYEISENEEGYVYLHGAIPSDVTHLCLGNTLYPLKLNEDRADLYIVLIGVLDMGEFLDKHDANPEKYPATFKRNE